MSYIDPAIMKAAVGKYLLYRKPKLLHTLVSRDLCVTPLQTDSRISTYSTSHKSTVLDTNI